MAEQFSLRRMAASDVDAVAAMHRQEFPHELLSRLGPAAIRFYYQAKLEAAAISLVAVSAGHVAGFALGTYRSSRGMRGAILRHPATAAGLLLQLMGRPWLLARLVESRPGSGTAGLANSATLAYMAVEPASRRQGVGRALTGLFLDEARQRGAERVVLLTQQAWEANEFYRELGFECVRTFRDADGQLQNEYRLELASVGS